MNSDVEIEATIKEILELQLQPRQGQQPRQFGLPQVTAPRELYEGICGILNNHKLDKSVITHAAQQIIRAMELKLRDDEHKSNRGI